MHKCPLVIAVILTAVLQTNCTLSQSPTNLTALQGLVPTSALANTAAGKAALAANFAVTAAVQDGSAKQPLLLPFPEQQQQALRDAYITDGNAYELADGLGTALSHAYWSVVTFESPDDGKTSSFTNLSPAIALLIAYTNSTTRSDSDFGQVFLRQRNDRWQDGGLRRGSYHHDRCQRDTGYLRPRL